MPRPSVSTLDELTDTHSARGAWFLDMVLPDVGGGRLPVAGLDTIEAHPQATALRISGLDQPTFEALVSRYGRQFSALHFWKCPRISDLTPLEDLPRLTHVAYYWNQRATRLWDLAKTPRLKGLQFESFPRILDLDDVAAGVSLEELDFGDAVWVKGVIASLAPLEGLDNLRMLSFSVRRIEDGRIQPLAKLQRLERLECPSNLFTTEQLAWLRARLPASAQGRVLAPIHQLPEPLLGSTPDAPKDVLVMGKRKPFLSSTADAKRIERYVTEFWTLVERFRANPQLEP